MQPENILFKSYESKELKICDFGLAKYYITDKMYSSVGTPYYIAPEILSCKGYNEKCDIWSLGIILYVMISGNYPYQIDDISEDFDLDEFAKLLNKKYSTNEIIFPSESWKNVSPQAIDLIRKILKYDFNMRPSASQILDHEWFELFLDDNNKGNKLAFSKGTFEKKNRKN